MSLESLRLLSREEFQLWFFRDEDVRSELYELMDNELDPDLKSLDTIEAFVIERFDGPREALSLTGRGVLDAVARHIGLVLVLSIDGARWDVELDDEDYIYRGLPVVAFADGYRVCPLTIASTATDRRTGDYVGDAVEGLIDMYDT